jgi:hypothetical protein
MILWHPPHLAHFHVFCVDIESFLSFFLSFFFYWFQVLHKNKNKKEERKICKVREKWSSGVHPDLHGKFASLAKIQNISHVFNKL